MKAEIKPRFNFEGRTRLETVIPLSTPYLVFLDPSDICNQHCPFCPSGDLALLKKVGRTPQLMDFDLYKKIIDDLCDMPEPIKTLRLYKDGESLLNPRFPDMVRYAKETGRFGQIDSTTNGSVLWPHNVKNIIDAGLDKIFVSVPENYDDLYVLNIANLYQYSRGKCEVYVKTIGDGMSELLKQCFMDNFGDISDRIFIENLAPCWPGYEVNANKEKGIYNQPLPEKGVMVCPYIFYSLAINSDGTVSLCFLDWKHQFILGDLKKESFINIWNGKQLRTLRKMMLFGHREKHPICGNCGQLSYGAPDDLDPYTQEILENILLQKVIE